MEATAKHNDAPTINIIYSITAENGVQEEIILKLDPQDLSLIQELPENLPHWTELTFHQCPNCPLTCPPHATCPFAAHLTDIMRRFNGLMSYHRTQLTVTTDERSITQDTTAQRSISSLIGLISATCGCPHTRFFRPMARFHLPLASRDETIYRATSMFLLAQYFRKINALEHEFSLAGLKKIYQELELVNQTMVNRLRKASVTDTTVNAIVLLDMYAKTLPYAIEASLDDIQNLFRSFLLDD